MVMFCFDVRGIYMGGALAFGFRLPRKEDMYSTLRIHILMLLRSSTQIPVNMLIRCVAVAKLLRLAA